ncbi:MAG TPA: amidohydrolase family protein [Burkholderiales bacterium]|nr:amidohydrolase family protein [Burkholderiales bacterium]
MRRYAFAILLLLPAAALAQSLALTGVTVIDATGAAPRPDMTVVIDGGRITALGRASEVALPEKTHVVPAAGKFLIPGLWDMHVHWNDAAYLPLFTANGVTGVRIMWGLPPHLDMRKRISDGSLVGPRLVLAGPLVDGPRPFWKDSIAAATPEQGRQAVQRTRAEGYDFVKVYDSLPRAVFFAVADEARKHNLPLAGHAPAAVGVATASDAGQKSIEHLTGMLIAVSSLELELRREFAAAARLEAAERGAPLRRLGARMLETYDADKAAALFARLKKNGTWQVPTLTVLRFVAYTREPQHASDPRLRYMPAWVRSMWANDPRYQDVLPEQLDHQKKIFQRRLELVGEMHRAGVGILAGSDALNPWCFPGFGLHDELEWLVKAGLSPMAALQAATRNPAVYLDRVQELGTVEQGKVADLVLLEADPTQDIRNTCRIAAVIAGGKLFSREALDRVLGDIERLAN